MCQPCVMLVVVPYAWRCTVTIARVKPSHLRRRRRLPRSVVPGSSVGDLQRRTPAIAVTRAYACVCVCVHVRGLLFELGHCLAANYCCGGRRAAGPLASAPSDDATMTFVRTLLRRDWFAVFCEVRPQDCCTE